MARATATQDEPDQPLAHTMTAEANDAARIDAEALAALERGDIGAAEARFRDAIARYGPRADRLAMLGQILLRLARPREAARALVEASAAMPTTRRSRSRSAWPSCKAATRRRPSRPSSTR